MVAAARRRLGAALASPFVRRLSLAAYTGGAIYLGYAARSVDDEQKKRSLPSGFRACCESRALSPAQQALPDRLSAIVGAAHVEHAVEQRGSRLGRGEAFAVVRPGTLQEAIDALQACVDADVCIIPQGANTGLTGASVPRGAEAGVDRPTVVINLTRLNSIMPIDGGQRMVCLAGAGIHSVLQRAAGLGKESHSVLGSIFLNPTTAAGIAFGSGGTQLRKGPVYTERLLYAKVDEAGKVVLVDTLGLKGSRQEKFAKLEEGSVAQEDVDPRCTLPASQTAYGASVCACDGRRGKQVARCNADVSGPAPNRSEGKVLILASVHDTFPKPKSASTMWISVKDFATAQRLKRDVCLAGGASDLPVSVEYMDKDAVRAVDEAGRLLCYMICVVGIGPTLKALWDAKIRFEALPIPFAGIVADKLLFWFNPVLPNALPGPIRNMTDQHEHHLIVTVGEFGDGEAERFSRRLSIFEALHPGATVVHRCTTDETPWVSYFRFAAAPAFRTWCIGRGSHSARVL